MANRRLDDPLRSRHRTRCCSSGRRNSRPGGSHPARAVRLPRPFACAGATRRGHGATFDAGMLRLFYALLAVLTLWLSASPPIGLWPAVTGCLASTSFGWRSRFTLLGVLCSGGARGLRVAIGSRPASQRVAALWPPGSLCALLVAEFADIPLATTAYRVPAHGGRRLARSSGEAVQRRRGARAYRGRGRENAGRPPTCFTRWRTGRKPSTVTADSVLRFTSSSSASSACFPSGEASRACGRSASTHAVVHIDLYPPGEWPIVEERLRQFEGELKLRLFGRQCARVQRSNKRQRHRRRATWLMRRGCIDADAYPSTEKRMKYSRSSLPSNESPKSVLWVIRTMIRPWCHRTARACGTRLS